MVLEFVGGLLGGLAGVVVGHPLDTVKVNLQTQDVHNPRYRGTWHCLTSLIKYDGARSLYRGVTSPMAGLGGVNAVVFGVYGNIQHFSKNPHSLSSHAIAGGVSGLCQSFICSPFELAKTRMQVQNDTYKGPRFSGPLQCMKHIIHTEGIRGSFRGLFSTILRDVPGFAAYFASYEYIMESVKNPNAIACFFAGGIAGIASWCVCYPTDVIKSCLQADGLAAPPIYKGIIDCAIKNYKDYGIKFFFRGFNSTVIRAFPVNAATFSIVAVFLRLSKGKPTDMVVHPHEPLVIVGLESIPFCYLHDHDMAHEVRKKRDLMLRGLRAFGTFHEAIFHTEAEDIVNEFYPISAKYYYVDNFEA